MGTEVKVSSQVPDLNTGIDKGFIPWNREQWKNKDLEVGNKDNELGFHIRKLEGGFLTKGRLYKAGICYPLKLTKHILIFSTCVAFT